jgi:hypothetical protein
MVICAKLSICICRCTVTQGDASSTKFEPWLVETPIIVARTNKQNNIHAEQSINIVCNQLCPGGQGGVLHNKDNDDDVCVYRSDGGSEYCSSLCRSNNAAAVCA